MPPSVRAQDKRKAGLWSPYLKLDTVIMIERGLTRIHHLLARHLPNIGCVHLIIIFVQIKFIWRRWWERRSYIHIGFHVRFKPQITIRRIIYRLFLGAFFSFLLFPTLA